MIPDNIAALLLDDLLVRFDPSIHCGEVWSEIAPVGQEFGALADTAHTTANRAASAVDEALRFVDESNQRIKDMEKRRQD